MRGLLLFPEYLRHSDVAAGRPVQSAGFVDLDSLTCYGESVSLGVQSCPMDTARLRAMAGHTEHAPELPTLLQRQAS